MNSCTSRVRVRLGAVLALFGAATAAPVSSLVAQPVGNAAAVGTVSSEMRPFPQPGDIVRLKIWREPDMSGEYQVDMNGIATFPRLGTVHVTTMRADSLQRYLVGEYARYLKNPSVEVALLRRVRVLGAVRTPGLYTADQTMRVRDVVALAGGATTEGRTDVVRLERDGRSTNLSLDAPLQSQEWDLRSGDQLYVPQRSWISRNTPLVAALVSVAGGLAIAFSNR